MSDCLTPAQLTQTALGVPPSEEITAHLRTCRACSGALAAQTVSMLGLQRQASDRRRSGLWKYAPTAVAAVLIVLMVSQIPRALQSASVLSATATVVAVVQRGDDISQEMVLQLVQGVGRGDTVRVRVEGSTHGNAYAQVLRDNKWETAFEGPIPDDGWLGGGIPGRGLGHDTLVVELCTGQHTAASLRGKPVPLDCSSTTTNF